MVKKVRSHSIKPSVMTDEEVYNTLLEAANESGGGGGGGGGGETWPDSVVTTASGASYTIPNGYTAKVIMFSAWANDQGYFYVNGNFFGMSYSNRTGNLQASHLEFESGTILQSQGPMVIELRLK